MTDVYSRVVKSGDVRDISETLEKHADLSYDERVRLLTCPCLENGCTVMHAAADNPSFQTFEMLLGYCRWDNRALLTKPNPSLYAMLRCKDDQGKTPLHKCRVCVMSKLLLLRGADPNMQDDEGRTPLHEAAELVRQHTEDEEKKALYQLLLRFGADPNVVDKAGISPASIVAPVPCL